MYLRQKLDYLIYCCCMLHWKQPQTLSTALHNPPSMSRLFCWYDRKLSGRGYQLMWLCKRWHVYLVPTSELPSWWHIQFWQSGWLEDMELEVRRLTTSHYVRNEQNHLHLKKDQTGVNYLQRMSNQYFVCEQTQKYPDINLSQFLSACSRHWCSQSPGQPLRAYMPVHTAAHSSHRKSELWSSCKQPHCLLGSRWSRSLHFLDLGPSLLWCHCFCNSSLQSHQWVGRWLRRGRDR